MGRWAIAVVGALGRFGTFLGQPLGTILTPPFMFWAYVDRIHYIGYRSLLNILLTGGGNGRGALPLDYLPPARVRREVGRWAPVLPAAIRGIVPVAGGGLRVIKPV